MRHLLLVAAGLIAFAVPAVAQTNPLQKPSTTETAKPGTDKPGTDKPSTAKPKRARSEAQLKNDNRLRACGAEWRENKPELTKKGYNWIKYSGECRKRLAAQGR